MISLLFSTNSDSSSSEREKAESGEFCLFARKSEVDQVKGNIKGGSERKKSRSDGYKG